MDEYELYKRNQQLEIALKKSQNNIQKLVSQNYSIELINLYIECKNNHISLDIITPKHILNDIKTLLNVDIRVHDIAELKEKIINNKLGE